MPCSLAPSPFSVGHPEGPVNTGLPNPRALSQQNPMRSDMKYLLIKHTSPVSTALLICVCMSMSCSTGQSNSGISVSDINQNTEQLGDEDMTTEFTNCIRGYGFGISDPTVNADGTIDWGSLKQEISQDPESQNKSNAALEKCLPLLQDATATDNSKGGAVSKTEAMIEGQDQLLEFAQCLRQSGITIPDPDFYNAAGGKDMLDGINMTDERQDIIVTCKRDRYGAATSKK